MRKMTLHVTGKTVEERGLARIGLLSDGLPPRVIVIGDSHGDMLMPAFDAMFKEWEVTAVVANRPATIPLFGTYGADSMNDRVAFHQAVLEALGDEEGVEHAILVARWLAYDEELTGLAAFRNMVEILAARGIKVWVVRQVPEPVSDVPRGMAMAMRLGHDPTALGATYGKFVRGRARLSAVLAQLEAESSGQVVIVDPSIWFFPDKTTSQVQLNGRALYVDAHHLTAFGALKLMPALKAKFEPLNADFNE